MYIKDIDFVMCCLCCKTLMDCYLSSFLQISVSKISNFYKNPIMHNLWLEVFHRNLVCKKCNRTHKHTHMCAHPHMHLCVCVSYYTIYKPNFTYNIYIHPSRPTNRAVSKAVHCFL